MGLDIYFSRFPTESEPIAELRGHKDLLRFFLAQPDLGESTASHCVVNADLLIRVWKSLGDYAEDHPDEISEIWVADVRQAIRDLDLDNDLVMAVVGPDGEPTEEAFLALLPKYRTFLRCLFTYMQTRGVLFISFDC